MFDRPLKQLGLSKSQIRIYKCLLQNGPTSLKNVSRETFITRTNCYNVIGKLIKFGLVTKAENSIQKIYQAVSPKYLEELYYRGQDDLQGTINDLLRLQTTDFRTKTMSVDELISEINGSTRELLLISSNSAHNNVFSSLDANIRVIDIGSEKQSSPVIVWNQGVSVLDESKQQIITIYNQQLSQSYFAIYYNVSRETL